MSGWTIRALRVSPREKGGKMTRNVYGWVLDLLSQVDHHFLKMYRRIHSLMGNSIRPVTRYLSNSRYFKIFKSFAYYFKLIQSTSKMCPISNLNNKVMTFFGPFWDLKSPKRSEKGQISVQPYQVSH